MKIIDEWTDDLDAMWKRFAEMTPEQAAQFKRQSIGEFRAQYEQEWPMSDDKDYGFTWASEPARVMYGHILKDIEAAKARNDADDVKRFEREAQSLRERHATPK